VSELELDFALLGHGEVGFEIGLHGEGSDVVFLLLDLGLVGESEDGSADLLLGGGGVVEDIADSRRPYFSRSLLRRSASLSICCLPASMKVVVLARGFMYFVSSVSSLTFVFSRAFCVLGGGRGTF
jgi:hypothetical protein